MKAEIEQRQVKRFIVLYELYKEVKANTEKEIKLFELAAKSGIKNGVFEEAAAYLAAEGLIDHGYGDIYKITHQGKKTVEQVVCFPDDSFDQFPPFKDMGI